MYFTNMSFKSLSSRETSFTKEETQEYIEIDIQDDVLDYIKNN